MNKKFYCLALGAFLGGILVSCTNELNEPITTPPTGDGTIKLVRAPEVYAWSGNQILGNTFNTNTRGEEGTEYYPEMPNFTDWCDSWWNELNVPKAEAPDNAIEVNSEWWNVTFTKNGVYKLVADKEPYLDEYGVWRTDNSIELSQFQSGSKIYVDGYWTLYDSPEENTNLEIFISENSFVVFDADSELSLNNVKIYNEGTTYIYNTLTSLVGCEIYDSGYLVVEQNEVGDNSDLGLVPNQVTDAIYSIGEVYFKGGVSIETEKAYFRKVCVDGQMTVAEGKTVHTGYLNADELYFKDGASVEMAPEGMIVAGTISAKDTSRIKGNNEANGYILTNEIIGINKTNGTAGSKMESQVSEDNFSTIFKNVDIYVTKTINNTQNIDAVESYIPTNGKTYALNMDEFDASEDDAVYKTEEGKLTNNFQCGVGYQFIPVPKDGCDKCGHPSHEEGNCPVCDEEEGCNEKEETVQPEQPEQPDQPGDEVVVPGMTKVPENVEINLSIEERDKNIEWLASHLSIHVRAATDVEVFIPLLAKFYCDADDMAILEKHVENVTVHGGPKQVEYNINGNIITLTVNFESEGIRVTTDGINQEVIDYLMDKNGDGITFEVWNYMNLKTKDWESGKDILDFGQEKEITPEELRKCLNGSTVKFLDKVPYLYVNAFMYNADGEKFEDDCTVTPKDQINDFEKAEEGLFYNHSPYNQLYWSKDYKPSEE